MSQVVFRADPSHVVLRPFTPADNPFPSRDVPQQRTALVVDRVSALPPATVKLELNKLKAQLAKRHSQVDMLLERRFYAAISPSGSDHTLSDEQVQLIGGYLLEEYAVEAAALFNPSITIHPDQTDLPAKSIRVLLTLRAVGEGHVSSIVFRVGTVGPGGKVWFEAPAEQLVSAKSSPIPGGGRDDPAIRFECGPDPDLSRFVLFPVAPGHRRGLEDLRLTRFIEDDGSVVYYGTYTGVAPDAIRQELMRTVDFRTFDLVPLEGRYAHTKGMALFPRRVGGYFAMLGRQDHENIWLLTSNDLYRWNRGEVIIKPRWPWEFIQIGVCGPPIEIDDGWLVITHGVGTIRSYSLGACLLDKDDPSKVLARTEEPILTPMEGERDGYVPNVIYSCGALVHDGWLILPHGVADTYATVTTMKVADLLARMR
jgi:predicted GH43/DUF377 family glycosyl hydrolase